MELASTAKDYMQPPTKINDTITVDECRQLVEHDPNDLGIVVDAQGKLLGVLSVSDIVLQPNLTKILKNSLQTSKIYRTNVVTCSPDDTLEQVLRKMDVAGVKACVVVQDNAPIGVVSRRRLREIAVKQFSQFRVKL